MGKRAERNFVAEFRAFVAKYEKESDRAIVVLTAAKLDLLLQNILQKYLVPAATTTDEFFDHQGPASTFSNKIALSYRLGLIDRDFARSLNLVRRMRNEFAHELGGTDLEEGSHRDRVRSLSSPYRRFPFFDSFTERFIGDAPPARAEYLTVLGFLIVRLESLYGRLEPVDYDKALVVMNKDMRKWKNDGTEPATAADREDAAAE